MLDGWKLVVPNDGDGPVELYHLPTDPGERDDVSARRLLMASLGTLAAVMIAVVAFGGPNASPHIAREQPAQQPLTVAGSLAPQSTSIHQADRSAS